MEFINPLEDRQIYANVEFPSGVSFDVTNELTLLVEKKLSRHESVKEVNSKVDPAHSSLIIKLKDISDSSEELMEELETSANEELDASNKYGIPVFVYFFKSGDKQSLREITVDVVGDEIEKLDEIVKDLAARAGKIKGVSSVVLKYKNSRPELKIIIDRAKAFRAGFTINDAGSFMRNAIQGGVATKFIEHDREVDVRVRFQEKFRDEIKKLKGYAFTNDSDRNISLSEIADFKYDRSPVKIYRKNKKRALSFAVRLGGVKYDEVIAELEKLKDVPLPENYRIEFGEEVMEAMESRRQFVLSLFAGLLIIYMILASYYESFIKPVYILAVIPVPVFIIIILLYFFNIPISILVYIGFIVVSGVVVIQALLIFRKAGEDVSKLSGKKAINKKLQISISSQFTFFLYVTCALVCFYLPLALIFGSGSALLRSITITIIIGIISAAIVTPIYCLYVYKEVQYFNLAGFLSLSFKKIAVKFGSAG